MRQTQKKTLRPGTRKAPAAARVTVRHRGRTITGAVTHKTLRRAFKAEGGCAGADCSRYQLALFTQQTLVRIRPHGRCEEAV